MIATFYSRQFILVAFLSFIWITLGGQTVTYLIPFTDATLASRAINTGLPVGSTAAAADVTGTGGASYTIPLALPAGTNGVVPQLALSYNSQGGDGPLGMGWQITGTSVITRVPRNLYLDGDAQGIDLTTGDRFALDGVRLIGKSGTYGADGATYATEAESFATITSKGTSGTGPTSFEVVSKDGTIMEYGNTTDSRWPQSGTSRISWRLNRIRYKDGNYITFVYSTSNEDWVLTQVNYTGNSTTGLAPYNQVKFDYLDRTDMTRRYEVNFPLRNRYLLSQISITGEGGAAFKKYKFNYAAISGHSMLREVIEVGSDNSTQLNSTILQYGDAPTAFQISSSSVVAGQSVDMISGDFDGDEDLLDGNATRTY